MNVKARQMIERQIARAAISGLLAAGYNLTVFDSEEYTVQNSTDRRAILNAMFTTDEDWLVVNWDRSTHRNQGWVRFVYGNDGWDVINDHTVNIEPALEQAQRRADFWEAK